MNMTSKLWWINRDGSGRLAIMSRPNSKNLREDLMQAKQSGVQEIISLLTADDVESFGLQEEATVARELGMKFKRYGIQDHGVPTIEAGLHDFLRGALKQLHSGKAVAIHCNSGKGRSGLIAGALLTMEGKTPDDAIKMLRSARHSRVPENDEQEEWIRTFAEQFHPHLKEQGNEDNAMARLRTGIIVAVVGVLSVAAILGFAKSHKKRGWRAVL
jgi:protein-tyrosine phosphatase